jgi:Uma2 family endonuclease
MAPVPALSRPYEVEYPESDGLPMAESDPHRDEMTYLIEALKQHFRQRSDVYVSGNLFLYYRQGDPSACVAPDVFVVRGVPSHRRRRYLLWEEGAAPCMVIEVTSRSTRHEDDEKTQLYAGLGVQDFFRFDPEGSYLRPRLQGFRLHGKHYRRMRPAADGSLRCRSLDLTLLTEGSRLRLIDAVSGGRLLRFEESIAGQEAAETEAVLYAARAAQQAARAAQESVRAGQEAAARREAEKRAAELEEEVARLRAELDRLART